MDSAKIKSLIDSMAKTDLAELEYSENGWSLKLIRHAGATSPAREDRSRSAPEERRRPTAPSPLPTEHSPENKSVMSPMFGVIYLRSSPDAPEFVSPGTRVTPGMTLCVVEAMKVFSEIKAEREGTIAEVLVASGQEIEVGQELMRFA